jgi:hypothetical protein
MLCGALSVSAEVDKRTLAPQLLPSSMSINFARIAFRQGNGFVLTI